MLPARHWTKVVLLVWILVVSSCGGRTSGWVPPSVSQGISDGQIVPSDARRPLKDGTSVVPDPCQPPLSMQDVSGDYQGSWSGTLQCADMLSFLKGTLTLSIIPAERMGSFGVNGTISTHTAGPIKISGSLSGAMNCSAYSGTLTLAGMGRNLSGTMMGTYSSSMSSLIGFSEATWTVTDSSNICHGNGKWSVAKVQ
jgi:hypothetical protein